MRRYINCPSPFAQEEISVYCVSGNDPFSLLGEDGIVAKVFWFCCLFVLCAHLQVLSSDNTRYGYNAATGNYEDLMAAGIIDPTKV